MAKRRSLEQVYEKPTEILRDAHQASRMVIENWNLSDTNTVDPQRDEWDELYKMYRGFVEVSTDDTLSNFHVPDTWAHIEAYVPRVAQARPRIEVWESEPNDAELARMHRALIFYDWRKLKIPFWIIPFVKAGLVFGTAAWRVRHRREMGFKSVRVPHRLEEMKLRAFESIRGLPQGSLPRTEEFERVESVIYDDPVLEPLDLDRLYPHPDGTSIDDIELNNLWIIDEQPGIEFSQIEAEAKVNPQLYDPAVVKRLGKLLQDTNPYDRYSSAQKTSLKRRQLENFGPQMVPMQDPHKRQVTLLTQQSRHQKTIVVREFPELPPLNVKNRDNVYGKIDVSVFTPIPDPMYSFYGQSLAGVLYSLNLEKDMLHNARMDRILGSIYPMFGVLQGSGPAPSQIRWRPWGTVPMDSPEDLWPLHVPEINLAAYREAAEIDQSEQKAAAADPFIGIGSAGTATATEASMLFQSAGTKAGLMYHILSAQTLERTGRMLIEINQRHKTRDQIVRLTGNEPVEISAQLLQQGFDSEPDLVLDVAQNEPMTRQFRLQRAINALQVVGSIPPESWQIPIVFEVGKKVLEGLDFEHLEGVVEEMRNGASQQQIMAQLQSQLAGNSASATMGAVNPETEGGRLAQDSGGSQGPRPA